MTTPPIMFMEHPSPIGIPESPASVIIQQENFDELITKICNALQKNEPAIVKELVDQLYAEGGFKNYLAQHLVHSPKVLAELIKAAHSSKNVPLLLDCMESIYDHLKEQKIGIEDYLSNIASAKLSEDSLLWISIALYEQYEKKGEHHVTHLFFFLSNYAVKIDQEKFFPLINIPVSSASATSKLTYFVALIYTAIKRCNFCSVRYALMLTHNFTKAPFLRTKMMPIFAAAYQMKVNLFHDKEGRVNNIVRETIHKFGEKAFLDFDYSTKIELILLREFFNSANTEDYQTIFALLKFGMENKNELFVDECIAIIKKLKIQSLMPLELNCFFLWKESKKVFPLPDVVYEARAPRFTEIDEKKFGEQNVRNFSRFIAYPISITVQKIDQDFIEMYKLAIESRCAEYLRLAQTFLLAHMFEPKDTPGLIQIFEISSESFRLRLKNVILKQAIDFVPSETEPKKGTFVPKSNAHEVLDEIRKIDEHIFKLLELAPFLRKIKKRDLEISTSEVLVLAKLFPELQILDIKGCTISNGVIRAFLSNCPNLNELVLTVADNDSNYEELQDSKLVDLTLKHFDLSRSLKFCAGKELRVLKLSGFFKEIGSWSNAEMASVFGLLAIFKMDPPANKIRCDVNVLNRIIPFLRQVVELEVCGFDISRFTLDLISQSIPELHSFSAEISRRIGPMLGNARKDQSHITLAHLNEFLKRYRDHLTELSLQFTDFPLASHEQLKLPENIYSLSLKCSNEEFLVNAIQKHTHILHLSIDCEHLTDRTLAKLPQFTKLKRLSILGTELTVVQLLEISKFLRLVQLTVKVALSDEGMVKAMFLQDGTEVTFA